jgi:hypothetical protein
MAVEGDIDSRNPKTLSLIELQDEEREVKSSISGNEIAYEETKAALEDDLFHIKIPTTRSD